MVKTETLLEQGRCYSCGKQSKPREEHKIQASVPGLHESPAGFCSLPCFVLVAALQAMREGYLEPRNFVELEDILSDGMYYLTEAVREKRKQVWVEEWHKAMDNV